MAEVQKDPDCEYLLPIEFDEVHAVAETKHPEDAGDPSRLHVYTLEQARIAVLV